MRFSTVLAAFALCVTAHAETLIHNNGFGASNDPLPGAPHYGSHVAESGANWDALAGNWGVRGTPDIGLSWEDGRFDTYTTWDGRGNVIQIDSSGSPAGSRVFTIVFTPAENCGVHIGSFALDAWPGGNPSLKQIDWSVLDSDGTTLTGGHWQREAGRDTISPDWSGEIGQVLKLRLDFTSGAGDYLALDDLRFDQIPADTDPLPAVSALKGLFYEGAKISVRFGNNPGAGGERVVVLPAGVEPGGAEPLLAAEVDSPGGELSFAEPGLPAGDYAVWLVDGGGAALAGPAAFSVAASPALTLDKAHYEPGDSLTATFSGGPGLGNDWIGIYPAGIIPSGSPPSTLWRYTNGSQTAGGSLSTGSVTFPNLALDTGNYNAWFLSNTIEEGVYFRYAGPVSFSIGTDGPVEWLVESPRVRHAVAGTAWSALLPPYLQDDAGVTFEKLSGPDWLTVAADGVLSGTPGAADAGSAEIRVRATRAIGGHHADTVIPLRVFPAGAEHVSRVNVMSYNVWLQWGQVNNGFRKGIASIVRSEADVIGFQESTVAHATAVAEALGWFRATAPGGDCQVVSRYPVVDSFMAGHAGGALIRLAENPRREIIVYSCHPDHRHYGPYAAENGGTAADVLAEENASQRGPQVQAIITGMAAHLAESDTVPVILTGDFNAPSHLDWTEETKTLHNGVGFVPFPASTIVHNAGMEDSYRLAHPDPFTHPGITWSPIHKETEPQDRIDFVYHKGAPLRVLSSEIFTTEVEATVGRWGVSVAPVKNNTWPSDHAACLTCYGLAPVDEDGNGLGDAWERERHGETGNDPTGVSGVSGLSNTAAMLLGLRPGQAAPVTLTLDGAEMAEVGFRVSEYALGRGLVVERSENLQSWLPLWSFDADPSFGSSVLRQVRPAGADAWSLRLADEVLLPKAFYRLRWNP